MPPQIWSNRSLEIHDCLTVKEHLKLIECPGCTSATLDDCRFHHLTYPIGCRCRSVRDTTSRAN